MRKARRFTWFLEHNSGKSRNKGKKRQAKYLKKIKKNVLYKFSST